MRRSRMAAGYLFAERHGADGMNQVNVVFWRDIPAQVIIGRGRSGAKVPLPERFEQAIDRAAMRAGMAGTDAYLSQWRKEAQPGPEGPPQEAAEAHANALAARYDATRLHELVENLGWSLSGETA